MRLPERMPSLPPAAAVPALVAVELAATAALGRGQGWPHGAGTVAVAALLLALQTALLYAAADAAAGRTAALVAGLLLALVPVVLAKRYFILGGGNIDYKTVYRQHVLPAEAALSGRAGVIAACLFLASAWLLLARTPLPSWAAAAGSSAVAAAAVLVHPASWPALAAPPVAAAVRKRWQPAAVALAASALGLGALALFRHVPHVSAGWHSMGVTLDSFREYSWSRRILEYLPLGGFVGLCLRAPAAGGFFGVLLVALVILPLAQTHDLTTYLVSIVPGLPVYMLLTACLGFLVPRGRAVAAAAARAS